MQCYTDSFIFMHYDFKDDNIVMLPPLKQLYWLKLNLTLMSILKREVYLGYGNIRFLDLAAWLF